MRSDLSSRFKIMPLVLNERGLPLNRFSFVTNHQNAVNSDCALDCPSLDTIFAHEFARS